MKRSEAIKILSDLLPDHLTIKGFHGNKDQVAWFLINELVKKGMQPPCKYEKIDDCMHCYNGHINLWEPEDK
jgi:hypothetical protein